MSQITTHVLDTSLGRPAAGVPVALEIQKTGGWQEISRGATDADGRLRHLLEPGALVAGIYRLTFETHAYFHSRKVAACIRKFRSCFRLKTPRSITTSRCC